MIQNSAPHEKCPFVVYAMKIFNKYVCRNKVDVMVSGSDRMRTNGSLRFHSSHPMAVKSTRLHATIKLVYSLPRSSQLTNKPLPNGQFQSSGSPIRRVVAIGRHSPVATLWIELHRACWEQRVGVHE